MSKIPYEKDGNYPKHIYDRIRIDIATTYLRREFKKYLPDVKEPEAWSQIDSSVEKWYSEKDNIMPLRQFWNGFHGMAMGFKLKEHFLEVLTAENITWKLRDDFPLDGNLLVGTDLSFISPYFEGKNSNMEEVREFFNAPENQEIADRWRKEFQQSREESFDKDKSPIIVFVLPKDGVDSYIVQDGNRRSLLAILEGKTSIPAYYGDYTSEEKIPTNFWIPTSVIMQFAVLAKFHGTEETYQHTLEMFRHFMKISESAKVELKERALNAGRFSKRLKDDLFPE